MSNLQQSLSPPVPRAVILVVDDTAVNRQALTLVLKNAGYHVVAASSAAQALQHIDVQVPDLIMLDIVMPVVDGYELCSKFAADPRTQKVPVIFISSLGEAVDKVKAFDSGGVDYVSKPFQAREVLARIAHQLKISRQKNELEREKAELIQMNEKLRAAQQTATVFHTLVEILPGVILDGKYQIEDLLGSGGFGVVYRATHLGLDRQVAIKVFRPPVLGNKFDALSRFQQEGVSACRVNHPNAVSILDSGLTSQGIAYLVMELLQGNTLYEEMQKYIQLSVERCLQIIIPLCGVLIAAHTSNIIHRDIKPANIMLHKTTDGEIIKVLDFGIAKLLREEARPLIVTRGNELLGTPTYMSPERLEGHEYDGRSDVYSIGIMLYEMLAGESPFRDRDRPNIRVLYNHLNGNATPISTHRPDLSKELADLIMRAMHRDPAHRPTAAQLLDELISLINNDCLLMPTARLAPTTSLLRPQIPSVTTREQHNFTGKELARRWNEEKSGEFANLATKR